MSKIKKIPLSDGALKILGEIKNAITESQHPMIEYSAEGIIKENSKSYDLTTSKGRRACERVCQQRIGYMTQFQAYSILEKQDKKKDNASKKEGANFTLFKTGFILIKTNKLEPWLSICLLINQLTFQMETQDIFDEVEKRHKKKK